MFEILEKLSSLFDPSSQSLFASAFVTVLFAGVAFMSHRRGAPMHTYRATVLGSFAQWMMLMFALNTRRVVLAGAAWIFSEWLYTRITTISKPQGMRWNWAFVLARITGVMALGLLAYTFPLLTWNEATSRLFACGTDCEPMVWALGLFAGALLLQSGVLKDRAHRGQTALVLFTEISLHRIPLVLFTWLAATRLEYSLPLETGRLLLTLGTLVFIVFQVIALTRNQLVDILGCTVTAHTGLFWALIGIAVTGANMQSLFGLYWGGQLLICGFAAFLVWLEREDLDLRERTLRGGLEWNWKTALPGMVFLAGLCFQPWVASGLFLTESLSQLANLGIGTGLAFAVGFVLQTTKMSHLALVMALPTGPRERLLPEKTTVWWLWIVALTAIALGVYPVLLKALL